MLMTHLLLILLKSNKLIIGSNNCNDAILSVDNYNRSVKINAERFTICDGVEKLVDVSKSNIHFNNLIRYGYQKLCINESCFNLYPEKSLIIINSNNCLKINLKKKKVFFLIVILMMAPY